MRVLWRSLRYTALLGLAVLSVPAAHAATWAPMASISATAALVTNSLCYTDGKDLVCNGAGPALGASNNVSVTTGASGSIVYRDAFGSLIANSLFSISSTTGSVGIGAGAPVGTGNSGLYAAGIIQTGTYFSGPNNGQMYFGAPGTGLLGNANTGYLALSAGNTEGIRIISSGLVGIGTTTPANALDVSGSVGASSGSFKNWLQIAATSAANLYWGTSLGTRITGDDTNKYLAFTTSGTEALRIVSTGYVGIGTTTPTVPLHVFGAGANARVGVNTGYYTNLSPNSLIQQGAPTFILNSNVSAPSYLALQSGNTNLVSIGLSTQPSTTLHIAGSLRIGAETSTTLDVCDTNRAGAIKYTSSDFYVCRNGTAWESLTSVGTGTGASTYTSLTDVSVSTAAGNLYGPGSAGAATTTSRFNTSFGLNAMKAVATAVGSNSAFGYNALSTNTTGNGNVGVGYAALASNTSGGLNTGIGYGALGSNSSGGYNVAIGAQALTANTTGSANIGIGDASLGTNTTGASNTSIGYYALSANTTGYYNTATGYSALGANTTGNSNTANGPYALSSNSTGSYNIAVGGYALNSNSTGGNNNAVGYNALTNNNGSNNVANGNSALYANSSGGNNVAIGYNSLNKNTTASNNAAFGFQSLGNNTTGANNTSIGSYSMNNGPTIGNSVAVGYQSGYGGGTSSFQNTTLLGAYSGYALTTGNSNTLIGYNAGGGITTGANNLVIGTNLSPYDNTGSNQLNIANSIMGDTGSPLATKIGINVPSPTAALEVSGTVSLTSLYVNGVAVTGAGGSATSTVTSGISGSVIWRDGVGNLTADSVLSYSAGGRMNSNAFATTVGFQWGNSTNNAILGSATSTQQYIAFQTSATEAMRITSGSLVGIGTTTPGYKLDVAGTINGSYLRSNAQVWSSAGTVSLPAFSTTGDTGTGIYFPSQLTMGLVVSGTEALRIVSTGYVGIGTSSPIGPLDVSGTSGRIYVDSIGSGLNFTRAADNYIRASATGGKLNFWSNGNTRMLLDSSGNVGIGISNLSASTTLHVSGTIKIADDGSTCDTFRAGAIRYTSSSIFQTCNGSSWSTLATGSVTPTVTTGASGSLVYRDATGNLLASSLLSISSTTGSVGIGAGAPALVGNSGLYVSSTIYSGANVQGSNFLPLNTGGILWPLGSEKISGDNSTNTITLTTSNTEAFRVAANGFIGISNSSPANLLHIGNARAPNSGIIIQRAAGSEPNIVFYSGFNAGVSATQLRGLVDGGLRVTDGAASTEYLRVVSTGLVGIGTSIPTANLEVSGTISATALKINGVAITGGASGDRITSGTTSIIATSNASLTFVTAGTQRMVIDTSGTTQIRGRLDLGLTDPSGSVTDVYIGPASGTFNGLGNYVTAIGYNAGQSNTGSSVSAIGNGAAQGNRGSDINAMGTNAANNNSGGDVNAFGFSAAYNNTGNFVDAFGRQAAQTNTGSNVNAFGSGSAYSNTGTNLNAFGNVAGQNNQGNFVNAFGNSAAYSNTGYNVEAIGQNAANNNTGNFVVALGNFAGSANTGNNITAFGQNAAYSNTGSDVVAIGQSTLLSNRSAGLIAIGSSALGNNTTGTANTAVGYYALNGNNTGSYNTVLGYAAGQGTSPTNLTASTLLGAYAGNALASGANSNTLIGYNAGSGITTGTNNLVIGTNLSPFSNTGSNQLNIGNAIFGDTAMRRIGINITSPTANLEVSGTISTTALTVNGVAITSGGAGVSTFASLTDVVYSSTNSNIFGPGSITGAATGSSFTTAMGVGALSRATYAGNNNSGFGYWALHKVTSGTSNSAFGVTAGQSVTTGGSNILFGQNAGGAITTGSGNTAMGYGTLVSAVSTSYNTALGFQALYNSTGTNNTSIGLNNGFNLTSGINNTSVGNGGLQGGTGVGSYNSSLGVSSLGNTSGGSYSVGIGASAGVGTGSASPNNSVFVGAYAGQSIGNSQSNTLIGYNAGGGITTGNNNLIIGASTTPYSNTGSNQLNIANAIWGDFGSGTGNTNKIGINVPSPTTALEVAGTISATALTVNGVTITGSGGGATDNITSGTATVIAQTAGTVLISTTNATVTGRLTVSGTTYSTIGNSLSIGNITLTTDKAFTSFGAMTGGAGGTDNSTFGYWSLTNGNTSSARNNAFGREAMYSTTSGVDNTAMGVHALFNNQTGPRNTALGNYTAGGAWSGGGTLTDTTAVGQGAGYALTTAQRNTLIGASSGGGLTTGSSNTLIGYNTGSGITTGNNNLLLGANVGPYSNTADYQLNIGNAIWGNIGSGTNNANLIGINVTSPTTALEVKGTISATALTINGVAITGSSSPAISTGLSGSIVYRDSTGNLISNGLFSISSTTGSVGIGAGAPASVGSNGLYANNLQAASTVLTQVMTLARSTTSAAQQYITFTDVDTTNSWRFGRNLSDQDMRIEDLNNSYGALQTWSKSGTVGIRTSSPSATLHVSGTGVFNSNVGIGTTTPGSYMLYVAGNAYSTGTWSTSDARYKENIQPLTGLLAKVSQLRPVTFTWKKNAFPAKDNPGEQIGLIAQEVEKIYPELVHTNSDGYKAVAYDKLGVLLLGAVKDLKSQNETLQSENAALKARNDDFEARLRKLEAATSTRH